MATKKGKTSKRPAAKRVARSPTRSELERYARKNGYPAHHFADAVCTCGGRAFALDLDDTHGAAVRTCAACKQAHPIGDSADYLAEASLDECACPCGSEVFAITVAVSLYEDSEDVRWIYLACRCEACKLAAVYGDWKNEYTGYRDLLARV
jgi:hypothetical protein